MIRPDDIVRIAVRLNAIATDERIALSVCRGSDTLKGCIRGKSKEIQSLAQTLLDIAKKG
jgi:hypothetical protein